MKHLNILLLGVLIGVIAFINVAQAATPALTVPQGGTGWGGWIAGMIPIGPGTGVAALRFATSTGFTFATSTNTLTATYASTTAVSAASLCLTGDVCRTTWPTGGSGVFPFTSNIGYNSTTTPIGFLSGLFSNSSTTLNGTINFPGIVSNVLTTNSGGVVTGVATVPTSLGGTGRVNPGSTSAGALLEFDGSNGSTPIGVGSDGTVVQSTGGGSSFTVGALNLGTAAAITGILPYTNGGTGTSTKVQGQLRYMGATADQAVATTTATCSGTVSCSTFTVIGSSPFTITGSASGGTFSYTPTTNYGVNVNSTSTPIWYQGAPFSLFASSTAVFTYASTTALSVSGLVSGNCVQASTGGLLTTTGSACGSGGSVNGTIGQIAYLSGTNTAVGTSSLIIDTTGFIGISSTTPSAKLSIHANNGDVFPTGRIFAIGSSTQTATTTLFAINNDGAIYTPGTVRITNSTGRLSSSAGNSVLIGVGAGGALTGNPTAIVAIGNSASGLNTSAFSHSVAIGDGAMNRTNANTNSVAVGVSALGEVTGDQNVAVGFQAMAGVFNTAQNWNVAVGNTALRVTSTGANYNTAVGFNAGGTVSSGAANVLLGSRAGETLTTGYGNTFVGASSSASTTAVSTSLSTGYNNTFLGEFTFGTSSTVSNFLNIGNLLFGLLPATSTAFLLPTTGAIGVGSSSPYATLSVHANNGSTNTTLFAIGSSTATATSTLFSVDNTGIGSLSIGSTTQTVNPVTGLLTLGSNGANGSSTISTGKLQYDTYNSAGTRSCAYIVGTAWVISAGACNP